MGRVRQCPYKTSSINVSDNYYSLETMSELLSDFFLVCNLFTYPKGFFKTLIHSFINKFFVKIPNSHLYLVGRKFCNTLP
jgi:hypothetical protein